MKAEVDERPGNPLLDRIVLSFFFYGAVAEWRCRGLQILECGFDSRPCLQLFDGNSFCLLTQSIDK